MREINSVFSSTRHLLSVLNPLDDQVLSPKCDVSLPLDTPLEFCSILYVCCNIRKLLPTHLAEFPHPKQVFLQGSVWTSHGFLGTFFHLALSHHNSAILVHFLSGCTTVKTEVSSVHRLTVFTCPYAGSLYDFLSLS